MIPNANRHVVKKLINRSLRANRMRNRFVAAAIVLTAWLITSVFSIGMSYVKSFQLQELKMMGTAAHAVLKYPTEEQVRQLQQLNEVRQVGLQASVAQVVNTPEMGNITVNLHWFDETEWMKLRAPVVDNITGGYPQQHNEVMVPTWILAKMGIDQPQLGMELPLAYKTDGEAAELRGQFVLSGWYTEYVQIRSGNIGAILVSRSLAESLGVSPERSGAASILFADGGSIEDDAGMVERRLGLQEGEQLKLVPLYSTAADMGWAQKAGFASIVALVMFSGYLLIYNVLHISVSRDIRFYGLLKTVGTTPRQIRRIVAGQANRLALAAIPAGLVIGGLTSLIFVPLALRTFNLQTGVEMSFNPLIFAGAALFAWITTMISCFKPSRIAGKVSPIEAIKYTGPAMKRTAKKGKQGAKLHRMAIRNIFRDRKRAAIVFLSLFLGMTIFLTVHTVILSMDTDHFVNRYMENDVDVYNNTLTVGYQGESKQTITQSMIEKIAGMDGVTQVSPTYTERAQILYDPAVFASYMDDLARRFGIERPGDEALAANREMFWGNLIGLEPAHAAELSKALQRPVDLERFNKGEIALLDASPQNVAIGDKFELQLLSEASSPKNKLEIGGFLSSNSQTPGFGMAPNVYVSVQALKQMLEDPLIYKLNIKAEKREQPQIVAQIGNMLADDHELYMESKLEQAADMEKVKQLMYLLGTAITLILAAIGVMNFINTMLTGIQVRKHEFAILESIGMTRRQLRNMLLFEGIGYAAISSLLIATLGSLISYASFRLFQTEADYAVYTFPAWSLCSAVAVIFAVCLAVPLLAYRAAKGDSIVERLRATA
ncbi:ABC transporter permease [Paenibacillus sp. GCM10027626]|uniref:ABC transporter permease n=1 Tax=Paenibacillus sp. GCM10027626 TaxID=3273411 RepID=UPI00362D5839